MKDALLAIHNQRSADGSHAHSNGLTHDQTAANQERLAPLWQRDAEYDEEEWVSHDVCDLFMCSRWWSVCPECVCVCARRTGHGRMLP